MSCISAHYQALHPSRKYTIPNHQPSYSKDSPKFVERNQDELEFAEADYVLVLMDVVQIAVSIRPFHAALSFASLRSNFAVSPDSISSTLYSQCL